MGFKFLFLDTRDQFWTIFICLRVLGLTPYNPSREGYRVRQTTELCLALPAPGRQQTNKKGYFFDSTVDKRLLQEGQLLGSSRAPCLAKMDFSEFSWKKLFFFENAVSHKYQIHTYLRRFK